MFNYLGCFNSIVSVVGENELGRVSAEVCRRYSIAIIAPPSEHARRARRQCALVAHLVYIERETGLDSALPCAAVSTGTATAPPTTLGPLGAIPRECQYLVISSKLELTLSCDGAASPFTAGCRASAFTDMHTLNVTLVAKTRP